MARPIRPLIRICLAVLAGLLLMAALAVTAVVLFVDADRFRPRIEATLSRELGRNVSLGHLHWDLGARVAVASEGGAIANAPGFDAAPLARWERLSFGLALRPLFDREVKIDNLAIKGLKLDLQRDATGMNNWTFAQAPATGQPGAQVAVKSVSLANSSVHYRDAASGADWRVESLGAGLELEPGQGALPGALNDISLKGQLFGGPLPEGGARIAFNAPRLALQGKALSLPEYSAQFDSTRLEGRVDVAESGAIAGAVVASLPGLRAQLMRLGIEAPATRDPAVFGALRLSTRFAFDGGALSLTQLDAKLDDTALQGEIRLPSLSPLALRFTLQADVVDVGRYTEPPDVAGEPFKLPIAALESLDASGVLNVREARFEGVTARDVAFTVD